MQYPPIANEFLDMLAPPESRVAQAGAIDARLRR